MHAETNECYTRIDLVACSHDIFMLAVLSVECNQVVLTEQSTSGGERN